MKRFLLLLVALAFVLGCKGKVLSETGTELIVISVDEVSEIMGAENVHLVDIHSEFMGHGIHCLEFWRKTYRADDPHWWYYTNLEDPNPRGHDAIRRLFLQEITKVFGH